MSNFPEGLFLPLKSFESENPLTGSLLADDAYSLRRNETTSASIGAKSSRTPKDCGMSHRFMNNPDVDEDLPGIVDVIIIGAGPAGLILAHQLARSGIKFVILDHNRVVLPNEPDTAGLAALPTQGILLNAHTLDLLQVMGLMHDVISLGRPVQGATIILDGEVVRQLPRFYKSSHSRFQTGVCLEQWKFERLLCDKLRQLGVKIYRQHVAYRVVIRIGDQTSTVESVSAQSHLCDAKQSSVSASAHGDYRVKVFVRKMDPIARRPHTDSVGKWLFAKYVIGADGVKSMTRRALEIDMIPLSPPNRYLVADFSVENIGNDTMARSHFEGPVNNRRKGASDNHLYIVHTKQNSGVFIPFATNNHWRLMISKGLNMSANGNDSPVSVGFSRLETPSDDDVKRIIEFLLPKAQIKSVIWRTAYSTATLIASQIVKERGVLIGDAAQQHPPLWSGGLNAAVGDAFALAWRLIAVLENRAIPALLETFDEEQRAFTKSVMQYSLSFRDRLVESDFIRRAYENPLLQYLRGTHRCLGTALSNTLIMNDDAFLIRSDANGGVCLSAARVLGFPATEDGAQRVASMDAFHQDSSHVMLLLLRVFPFGYGRKTFLGCEKKDLTAARYSKKDVDDLVGLAKASEQVFCFAKDKSPRSANVVSPVQNDSHTSNSSRLIIVWVICGLIDSKSVKMKELTLSHSQLIKQVPVNLRTFMAHGCAFKSKVYTVIDHECQIQTKTNLDLAPVENWADEILLKTLCQESVEDNGAAFVLMRPDGKVAVMGYTQDSRSRGALEEYNRHFFGGLS